MNTMMKFGAKKLADFVFANNKVKQEVMRYVKGGSISPLVLFGPHGTGKSTLAKLIPEAIDGPSVYVNKVKASSLNNEREVLEKFTRHAAFDNLFTYEGQSKNYTVIEEVNFEAKASSAMRVALDQMAGKDLFIFTTNDVKKIDAGLESRATLVEVPPVMPNIFLPKALEILITEDIELDEGVVLDLLDSVYELHMDNRKYYEALDQLIWHVRQVKRQ